jgi:hypothetical protein
MSAAWGPPPPPDPELEDLFGSDAELLRIAEKLRESRPEPVLDPRFHAVLRARLMREAQTVLAPRRPRFRLHGLRPAAWGSLAAATAIAAAVVATVVSHPMAPNHASLAASSPVAHDKQVDPHQAILVRFSQPMNTEQTATLARQLKIHPATAFSLTWKTPTTLVVTPLHALATNTDYQVVIPSNAVHSQAGQTLQAPVTISFGTTATPTPRPSTRPNPTLTPSVVGSAGSGASAFWGPGNTPGETVSRGSSGVSASPSPAPTTSSGGAVLFPAGSSPVTLSSAPAAAAALSPNEYYLALALPVTGGDALVYEDPRSGDPRAGAHRVWPASGTPAQPISAVAWANDYEIVFATAQGIDEANVLNGHTTVLLPFPSGGAAAGVILSPDGRSAFVPATAIGAASTTPSTASASPSSASPAATGSPEATPTATSSPSAPPTPTPPAAQGANPDDGWLVTGLGGRAQPAEVQLAGSATGLASFSGDGSKVLWVAGSGGASLVRELGTADPSAVPAVLPGASGSGAAALALNRDGSVLAESLVPGGLSVVDTSTGAILGTAPDTATSLAFSPDGGSLAAVSAGSLKVAPIHKGSTGSAPASACAGADQVLSEFVRAQVAGSTSQMDALSAPGVDYDATPPGLSRGYVVSTSCASDGPALTASARLILDPAGSAPGQFTDESVALGKVGGGWLVTSASIPPLRSQGGGPKVLTITVTPPTSGMQNPESLVTVTFDSDLDPATVNAGSLWITGPDGASITLLSGPTYDPETREATFTVAGSLPAGSSVVAGTAISDIDGGHRASQVAYPIGG